jgi:hypothetical protein
MADTTSEASMTGKGEQSGCVALPASLDRRLRVHFHDHSRFWSAELTRVFACAIRSAPRPRCDIVRPHDDAEMSDGIVRGVD